ncbi:MAG TPA: CCA tRNA nucleotidyltransferase [Bryobacteraceae bacterium]
MQIDESLSWARASLATALITALRAHGHKAYLVGGCVRDRLLGITPKDFDIATAARPDEVLHCFPQARLVGAQFGVVLVSEGEGIQVEVATFRSEGAYSDGRRPDAVRYESEPALDARRRDFTINGLLQDPLSGEVLDYVGGKADLEAKVIRAIGNPDQRFEEDHLRMLRAIRFASRLGFSIESETFSAIQRAASRITRISPERIREELIRILTEGAARRGFELLDSSGLLECIAPEIKAYQGVEQPPEYHPEGDVWTHVMLMLERMCDPEPTLALGVLFHDVGKPSTFRVADRIRFDGHAEVGAAITKDWLYRLRFSNDDVEQVTSLVANHMRFKDVRQMRLGTLKRFLSLPHFEQHLELHRLDCLSSHGQLDSYNFVQAKLSELGQEDLRPAPLISGHDLIQAGYTPGQAFGEALKAVETGQLEGEVQTREQALTVAIGILDKNQSHDTGSIK